VKSLLESWLNLTGARHTNASQRLCYSQRVLMPHNVWIYALRLFILYL